MAAINGASGLRMLLTWARREGGSLIQWRERELRTSSNVLAEYGRVSSSCRTSRVMEMRSLKGRGASRWRRVGEESAAMRCVIRVERGGEDGFEGSGSGFGSV